MKLKDLLQDVEILAISGNDQVEVEYLSHFDKDIKPNTLFFCIKGERQDGVKFALQAIRNGATVIVTSQYITANVTQVLVKDTRLAMALIAKNFYGRCADKLNIIGITGTNGKTSCTYILQSILIEDGIKCGVIGTNGAKVGEECLYYGMTTPDPIKLHEILKQMVDRGITHVIMEVSAHAIALNKMAGITLSIGVLTNITYEHVDFFHTFENYAKTKMSYFCKQNMKECVVNVDQEFGVSIAKHSGISSLSYGMFCPANVFAVDVKMNEKGMTFIVNCLDEILYVTTSLVGTHNVYNILACIMTAKLLGIKNPVIVKGIENLKGIEGRYTIIPYHNSSIVIDFAHTPDGFEQVLSMSKQFVKGKMIVLFGATYYADSKKCEQMGKIASSYAQLIVLTADNPDKTPVAEINNRILKGIQSCAVRCIDDRKQAIAYAISKLEEGDMLLCLGKGAEIGQKINGQIVDYNEIKTIKQMIADKTS